MFPLETQSMKAIADHGVDFGTIEAFRTCGLRDGQGKRFRQMEGRMMAGVGIRMNQRPNGICKY